MATDFHILCGFLGSGKTTLLLDFLGSPEAADTAVLVNDVGAIDIDGAVVAQAGGDGPVAMLSNGCVCCSIGNDLVATVDGLVYGRIDAGQPPFRRMILECSGLSRPGPIVRSLADLGAHGFRVRVLSTFDAGQGAGHAANFEEAAAQLAAAQTVVLTKLDVPGATAAAAAAAAARAINPLTQVVAEADRSARALAAFASGGAAAAFEDPATVVGGLRAMRHPRIGVFLATLPAGRDWDAVAHWIEDLAARCGDRLLRVKGLVAVAGVEGPLLIQGVGTVFGPPMRMRPDAAGSAGRVVIIACDLPRAELAEACDPHGVSVVET